MYLGKREILNAAEYEERRKKCIEFKSDATATAFSELEDIINKSQLARQYFGKSQSWFSQRVHGCMVLNKSMAFKEEEYHLLGYIRRNCMVMSMTSGQRRSLSRMGVFGRARTYRQVPCSRSGGLG